MLPKGQRFLLLVAGGGGGKRAVDVNCAGACPPEHARALCLVKGSPAAPAVEQSTMGPSRGRDVCSLKGSLNPEEARNPTPGLSAACQNLPVSPRSRSSSIRAKLSSALGHRRERGLAGATAAQLGALTSEGTQFPNSDSLLPVDLGTPKADGQH